MSDIHTCSYYCDRPRCIKAQRDELRDKFQAAQAQAGKPIAAVRGYYNGMCVVDTVGDEKVLPVGMALYSQPQAQAVNQQLPEGYVLAPVEPTEAMIDAGVAVAFSTSVHGKGGWNNYMNALYRAFIAAAQDATPSAVPVNQQLLEAQAGDGEAFCDANCTWLDHHKDCAVLPLVWMRSEDAARAMIAVEGERAEVSPYKEFGFDVPLYTAPPAEVNQQLLEALQVCEDRLSFLLNDRAPTYATEQVIIKARAAIAAAQEHKP